MRVAVLLRFFFHFGSDGTPALATGEEAAICLRVVLRRAVRVATRFQHFLHAVKQLFRNERRMCAVIDLRLFKMGSRKGYDFITS